MKLKVQNNKPITYLTKYLVMYSSLIDLESELNY